MRSIIKCLYELSTDRKGQFNMTRADEHRKAVQNLKTLLDRGETISKRRAKQRDDPGFVPDHKCIQEEAIEWVFEALLANTKVAYMEAELMLKHEIEEEFTHASRRGWITVAVAGLGVLVGLFGERLLHVVRAVGKILFGATGG